MPFKLFQDGNLLTAQEVNEYMMAQQIMVFPNASARDTAITSPTEGMFAFLKDTDKLTVFKDQWRNV
jgi:hypothetical protein